LAYFGFHPCHIRDQLTTRARIAAAARRLILNQGYEGATIEAIAREAGVATPTVYAVFGSKRRILSELIDRAAFGPAYQALVGEVKDLVDPVARLRLSARIARQVYDSERLEFDLLRKAGMVIPDLAAIEHEKECGRYEGQASTITHPVNCLQDSMKKKQGTSSGH
jgi:AcrR family transcriptional regulator